MATNRPMLSPPTPLEMPAMTLAAPSSVCVVKSAKALMIPNTVPSDPKNGALEPVVPMMMMPLSNRVRSNTILPAMAFSFTASCPPRSCAVRPDCRTLDSIPSRFLRLVEKDVLESPSKKLDNVVEVCLREFCVDVRITCAQWQR